MDSILKIIYENFYYNETGHKEYFLNGVHPQVISYIKRKISSVFSNGQIQPILDKLENMNENSTWSSFFRHANFLGYYRKHYQTTNIISIEEIDDLDNNIYLYPIEVGGGLDDFLKNITLKIENETFNYEFINTIDTRILEKLKTGKVKLLINVIHDPLGSSLDINNIEKYFNKHGIDGSNIIIIGGNGFKKYYESYSESKIKLTYGYIMVQQAGERISNFPYVSSLGYVSDCVRPSDLTVNKLRSKKFLCWNRTMRNHRYWIAYLAIKHKLLDNGYFTFVNSEIDNYQQILDILNPYTQNFNLSKFYSAIILNNLPIELDTQHLSKNQKYGFPTNNNKKEFYENSYVHLTSETMFEDDKFDKPFFSEKTFHPIVNLQPFIHIGSYKALEQLKNWGLKTFHPYIDESYDNEPDPVLRFKMIENEILKLNDKSIEELHNWYYSILDILIHNQEQVQTFSNMNPFENALNDIKHFYS